MMKTKVMDLPTVKRPSINDQVIKVDHLVGKVYFFLVELRAISCFVSTFLYKSDVMTIDSRQDASDIETIKLKI